MALTMTQIWRLLDVAMAVVQDHTKDRKRLPTIQDPCIRIIGEKGTGKTTGVRDYAIDRGYGFEDIRLSQIPPEDAKGLPVRDLEKKITEYFRPGWMDRLIHPRGAVLLLGEFSRAGSEVRNAFLSLFSERKIGDHVLPDNVLLVADDNPVGNLYDVQDLDEANRGRFCHIAYQPSIDDYLTRLKLEDQDESEFLGFIALHPELFLHAVDSEQLIGVIVPDNRTGARAREMIKRIDRKTEEGMHLVREVARGFLGRDASTAFLNYLAVEASEKPLTAASILKGYTTAGLVGKDPKAPPYSPKSKILEWVTGDTRRNDLIRATTQDVEATIMSQQGDAKTVRKFLTNPLLLEFYNDLPHEFGVRTLRRMNLESPANIQTAIRTDMAVATAWWKWTEDGERRNERAADEERQNEAPRPLPAERQAA